MLTAKETIDAIKHARATGERPTGHYDHDASHISGPVTRKLLCGTDLGEKKSTHGGRAVILRSEVDSVTGETIRYFVEKID